MLNASLRFLVRAFFATAFTGAMEMKVEIEGEGEWKEREMFWKMKCCCRGRRRRAQFKKRSGFWNFSLDFIIVPVRNNQLFCRNG